MNRGVVLFGDTIGILTVTVAQCYRYHLFSIRRSTNAACLVAAFAALC